MSETKVADITEEQMLEDGWVMTIGDVFLFKKSIDNRNPLNSDPEETGIKLVVHGMYNCWTFAVLFPDGGMLNFVANSMADLKKFEEMINFFDPPF